MPDVVEHIHDFNQNIGDTDNPRLVGYLPVDYFRVVDTDHSSRRIRDVAIPIEHFYDFNLENVCCNNNDDNE